MFKKFAVSVVLGVSLLSSIALWAKSGDKPVVVAKLSVEHQLSISAYEMGEDNFIQQVGVKSNGLKAKKEVPMPLLSGLGVMVFGLMYFVLRSSRKRVQ